jgi:hypothetical protein
MSKSCQRSLIMLISWAPLLQKIHPLSTWNDPYFVGCGFCWPSLCYFSASEWGSPGEAGWCSRLLSLTSAQNDRGLLWELTHSNSFFLVTFSSTMVYMLPPWPVTTTKLMTWNEFGMCTAGRPRSGSWHVTTVSHLRPSQDTVEEAGAAPAEPHPHSCLQNREHNISPSF